MLNGVVCVQEEGESGYSDVSLSRCKAGNAYLRWLLFIRIGSSSLSSNDRIERGVLVREVTVADSAADDDESGLDMSWAFAFALPFPVLGTAVAANEKPICCTVSGAAVMRRTGFLDGLIQGLGPGLPTGR